MSPPSQSFEYGTDMPTEDIMAEAKRKALGIWFQQKAHGYTVHARTGQMRISNKFMGDRKIDTELNVFFNAHKCEGWKPCAGKCAGTSPPAWYHVDEEDPPTVTGELLRTGCIGYCRTARRQ